MCRRAGRHSHHRVGDARRTAPRNQHQVGAELVCAAGNAAEVRGIGYPVGHHRQYGRLLRQRRQVLAQPFAAGARALHDGPRGCRTPPRAAAARPDTPEGAVPPHLPSTSRRNPVRRPRRTGRGGDQGHPAVRGAPAPGGQLGNGNRTYGNAEGLRLLPQPAQGGVVASQQQRQSRLRGSPFGGKPAQQLRYRMDAVQQHLAADRYEGAAAAGCCLRNTSTFWCTSEGM